MFEFVVSLGLPVYMAASVGCSTAISRSGRPNIGIWVGAIWPVVAVYLAGYAIGEMSYRNQGPVTLEAE